MTRTAVRQPTVAIPNEHGGWSLTLEPALLGLLVAPGWAGILLALAGVVITGAALAADLVGRAAFMAIVALAAVQFTTTRVKPSVAAVLGAQQLVLGLAVVLTAGLSFIAP